MKYGLTKATVDKIKGVFARFPAIEKAVLYGSRAKGNFKTGSDIDLTLYGESLTSDLHGKIAEALDDLFLPYTVDLSIFDDLDHAKLREHIERVGVVFYERAAQGVGLKEGWEVKKLGEVCFFLNRGISPKYLDGGGICVLNQKCVREHRLNFAQSRRHDLKAKPVSKDRFIQVGDVLVNSTGTGTLGRVAQVRETPNEPTTVDSHVTIVRPQPGKFFPDFFGYMLILIEEAIKEAGEGCGGQTELSRSVLAEKFVVSYPISLPEQKRIVAILDEVFEDIATAKANAEKNLQNAREVFDSYLQSVFCNPKYEIKTLGELCESVEYGSSSKSKSIGKIPVLRMENIQDGRLNWDNLAYSNDDSEIEKYLLEYNDVLFNRTNSPELVGKTAIYKGEMPAIFAGYLIRIHRKKNVLDADYLTYFLNSNIAKKYGKTVVISSVNQANINGTKLKSYPLPTPSLSEQKSIVAKLDALSAEIRKLEAIYQQKLSALEELKKSVLNKAFSGELN